jgi:FkbM family methyltransferase
LINGFFFHRRHRQHGSSYPGLTENLLGNTVQFFSYGELVNLFEEIFIDQVYSFKSSNKNPLIVDGGSNIGLSILYFKMIYPTCRILAFEPNPKAYKLLNQNISNNHLTSVTQFNVALSDQEGDASLYPGRYSGSLTSSLFNYIEQDRMELINTRKASSYLHEEVDLLKLDVEGSESEILNDLITSKKINLVKEMIIEFHPLITKVTVEKFIESVSLNNFLCKSEMDLLHPGSTEWIIHCTRKEQ